MSTGFEEFVFDWSRERHFASLDYDSAYHSPDQVVKASYTDISKWTNLDARVVQTCLRELQHLRLVHKLDGRSWEVPLANLDMKEGHWTPVPRLLINRYIPACPVQSVTHVSGRSQTLSIGCLIPTRPIVSCFG